MTEEEAKTKWCPMARVSSILKGDKISAVANRDISLLVPTNDFDPATDLTKCIASSCMAWRTLPGMEAFSGDGDGIDWIRRHRAIYGSSLKEAVEAKNTQKPVPGSGYCGLAGREA